MRRFACFALFPVICLLLIASTSSAQMSPEDELKTLRAAEDLDVGLFASEPMITNPSCIDVDTQGRVWVAEIQFYRGAAKNPPQDKIKVLEDTDNDGRADKVTVFADNVFAPMSICVCGDKVYAFVQGDLLMWEDKNGDLKADGPPKTIISGFSKANHDHTAHSIVVGPDHKWYMAHGDTGFNATGTDGSKAAYRFGAMVRGELDGSKLENIAVNFRNPYEICVSSFGESFCSDNDNDGNESVRICWILEGGNYGWNGGPPFGKQDLDRLVPKGTPFREAWHFRGWIPGNVPGTVVTGFGSPTGICFYEGDAIESLKNAPLHADPGPRVLREYRHKTVGAGMTATSKVWLTNEGDNYFRPDDVVAAPDGALFVSDWYDGGVGGHGYNNPNQGRIFRVTPKGKKLARKDKAGPYTSVADAIEGLKSPNLATQFLAREKLLAEGQGAVPALQAMLKDAEPNNRARALWVLDRIGGGARKLVVEQLTSKDDSFRALAVRILRRHGDEFAEVILPLAADSSGEVQREVILACGKISGEKAFKTLAGLAANCDGTDRYLLEAINIAAGEQKEQLYKELESSGKASFAALPLLQLLNPQAAAALVTSKLNQSGLDAETVKSLVASAGNIPSIEAGRGLVAILGNDSADADLRLLALGKLNANLGGSWSELAAEPGTVAAIRKALANPAIRSTALAAIGSHAMKAAAPDVLAIAAGKENDAAARQQAIGIAVVLGGEGTGEALRGLLVDGDAAVRQTALNAIVDSQNMKLLRDVLTGEKFPQDMREATAKRLMQSTGGALVLLRMIDNNEVTAALKTSAIALAAAHPDANVRMLFEKYIPEDQRPKKLGTSIKPEEILALSGDVSRGEQIFNLSSAAQCKNCHLVHGTGGNVGPDLSMIGRKYEKGALLETIMNPSKAISHEYRPYMLETADGQVFVGFLVEKTGQFVSLKDIKGTIVRVPAGEVESLVEQQKSLMPELVLQEVSAQDAADLLAFMMSLKEGQQTVTTFRVLGPIPVNLSNVDAELEPEKSVAAPDWSTKYTGQEGKPVLWEVLPTTNKPFPAFDTVKYDTDRGLNPNSVAHFAAFTVQSSAAQDATLQVGSDDGIKVWVNGEVVHKKYVSRGLTQNEDTAKIKLKPGRNVIVCKVINGNGGGGLTVGIRASEPIELGTE